VGGGDGELLRRLALRLALLGAQLLEQKAAIAAAQRRIEEQRAAAAAAGKELGELRATVRESGESVFRNFRQLAGRVEELDGDEELPSDEVLPRVFVADVDADGTFTEMTVVGGSLVNYTDGRVCSDVGDPSKVIDLAGSQAVLLEVVDPPDHRYVRIRGGEPLIEVYLDKVGGADGDGTTAATWTYDAFSDAAMTDLIEAAVSLATPRAMAAPCTPATSGIGRRTESGFRLLIAFEVFQMGCDDE
jgi:hypothetical protein